MATMFVAGAAIQEPEDEFHLSAKERASLWPHYDADALEAVLRRVPVVVRARLLGAATRSESPRPLSPTSGVLPGPSSAWKVSLPTQLEDFRFEDPALQWLLQQVWQPRRGR